MATEIILFAPMGAGQEVDVTSSAQTVAVATDPNTSQPNIRFVNHGSVKCRVRFSDPNKPTSPQTAVTDTTGFVLLPGVPEVMRLNGAVSFSVKTESGTTDLNVQLGGGA